MNVAVENAGPCRKVLKVDYTADEVQQEFDESLAVYVKHGSVKGFRPGRAPKDMIRRQYEKQILDGVRDHLLAKGYQQAVREHGFEPIAEMNLQPSELSPGQPFSFSVTLDVEPRFDLPEYKGLAVDTRQVEVTDEAVTAAIDRYLEHTGKYEDVAEDRPVRENDMVAVDYTATVDGRPMADLTDKAAGLAAGSDYWVIANEEHSFLPGFGPQLVGLKVGESKEISVPFNEQAPIEELRGKTGVFAATVKNIRARVKPPVNEELFKSLNVKDEAELRDTFRRMLTREAESGERSRRRQQVIEALMKSVEVDVPESEAHTESHRIVYEMVEDHSRRGISEQEIRDNIGKITESAQTAARDRVKLRYLLKRIAQEEKIAVSESEVSALMAGQAMRLGFRTAKEWLAAGKLKEKNVREGLREDLLTSKTIDLLLSHARLTGEGAAAEEVSSAPAGEQENPS